MDLSTQANGFIADFKAFLAKTNAVGAAVAIAIGFATVQFISSIVHIVINPILDLIKISDRGFWVWIFDIGGLITATVSFVATMFVIFVLGKFLIREKPAEAPKV